MKALTAGSEIDSWCTKCRLDLMHRIVAMVQATPKRVICLTCGSEHNYRAPRTKTSDNGVHVRAREGEKKVKAPNSTERVTLKARAEQERHSNWSGRTLGKAVDAFTRYSMERSFKEGELVMHSKFGEGYVEKVLEGGKVSIMFRDGAKTLAHRPG